jgi:hypothetical protein
MTTYKSDDTVSLDSWSCNNYEFYIVQGSNNKNLLNDISKYDEEKITEQIVNSFGKVNIKN